MSKSNRYIVTGFCKGKFVSSAVYSRLKDAIECVTQGQFWLTVSDIEIYSTANGRMNHVKRKLKAA